MSQAPRKTITREDGVTRITLHVARSDHPDQQPPRPSSIPKPRHQFTPSQAQAAGQIGGAKVSQDAAHMGHGSGRGAER